MRVLIAVLLLCIVLAPAVVRADTIGADFSADGRTVVDARTYPWSAIGRVQWTAVSHRAHCTGTMISDSVVLTAAHCLYNLRARKWVAAGQIHFLAGYHKGDFQAHSVVANYRVSKEFDLLKGVTQANLLSDWALLRLKEPIGRSVGHLGWAILGPEELRAAQKAGSKVILAGYPQNRSHVISVDNSCSAGMGQPPKALINHSCVIVGGDSGGPVMLDDGKVMTVIGLNSARLGASGNNSASAVPLIRFQADLLSVLKLSATLRQAGRGPLASQ